MESLVLHRRNHHRSNMLDDLALVMSVMTTQSKSYLVRSGELKDPSRLRNLKSCCLGRYRERCKIACLSSR